MLLRGTERGRGWAVAQGKVSHHSWNYEASHAMASHSLGPRAQEMAHVSDVTGKKGMGRQHRPPPA